jgi:Ca2+-binding RTX toxin-like protein
MNKSSLAVAMVVGAIIFNGWAVPAHGATRCFGKRATIVGTGRADRLIGTPRADVIVGLAGSGDLIKGRGGNDLICGNQGRDRIFGGGGNDKIKGENGLDTLFGQKGRDLLRTGGNIFGFRYGPDVGNGGGGADTLVGTQGVDRLSGRRGNDVIRGRGGDESREETEFSEMLSGGAGDDSIVGGTAFAGVEEYFLGGPGDDRLDGNDDIDQDSDAVDYGSAPGPVSVDLALGTAQGQGNDTLIDISSVLGSAHDDALSGDDGSNWLGGGDGDDTLAGRTGDDLLGGGDGDDVMEGGPGRDMFFGVESPTDYGDDSYSGGDDIDHISFYSNRVAVTVDLAAGTAAGWGNDSLTELENVSGGPLGDILLGDSRDNVLWGNPGVGDSGVGFDTLSGRGGNDTLYGGFHDDVLSGGDGDDFLDGDHGTNSNDGGTGFDTCKNPDTDGGAVDCEA